VRPGNATYRSRAASPPNVVPRTMDTMFCVRNVLANCTVCVAFTPEPWVNTRLYVSGVVVTYEIVADTTFAILYKAAVEFPYW